MPCIRNPLHAEPSSPPEGHLPPGLAPCCWKSDVDDRVLRGETLRTGSDPEGSSPKRTVSGAAGLPDPSWRPTTTVVCGLDGGGTVTSVSLKRATLFSFGPRDRIRRKFDVIGVSDFASYPLSFDV